MSVYQTIVQPPETFFCFHFRRAHPATRTFRSHTVIHGGTRFPCTSNWDQGGGESTDPIRLPFLGITRGTFQVSSLVTPCDHCGVVPVSSHTKPLLLEFTCPLLHVPFKFLLPSYIQSLDIMSGRLSMLDGITDINDLQQGSSS